MRKIIFGVLIGVFAAGEGYGESRDVPPVESANIITESESVSLLRFEIPESVSGRKVVRAILQIPVTCESGRSMRAHVTSAPTTWKSAQASDWWALNRQALDHGNVFESGECRSGTIRIDVTRQVRSWSVGYPNHGFVIQGKVGDERLLAEGNVLLRLTIRPTPPADYMPN